MEWLLYGCRTALAPDVAEIIWRRGDEVAALVDNIGGDPVDGSWAPDVAVISAAALSDIHRALAVAVPQTTPGHRHAVAQDALSRGCADFPPLVDPRAIVARTARLARGVVVSAGAVIGALADLGEFALINRSASVGHHARIGPFASLGPACVLAGQVTIGRGAFVGAGATCAPGVTVGANATVGAGAVVIADVGEGQVVVGNPARVVRSADVGFGGVGVPIAP